MCCKKILFLILIVTIFQNSNAFTVYDPVNAIINKASLSENITQTSKLIAEVSNSAQTAANTLNHIQLMKRNLEHFANWQNLSGFQNIANKMNQASDFGNSLGAATDGIANGLTAMTGDKYTSLAALTDTLQSAGRVLDQQAAYINQQNMAYDRISQGLNDKSLDGAVAVMQGNANLLNAIAQQNQSLGSQLDTLNKIQLARTQNEINEKNIESQVNNEFSQSSLAGLLDYRDHSSFDFKHTPKYRY